jgi:hypothetical protein
VALVWLLAAGAAVAATLVRFPPGAPLRPLRPAPSAVWRSGSPRVAALLVRRERVLAAGWLGAPLAAAVATVVWALAGERRRGDARVPPPGPVD